MPSNHLLPINHVYGPDAPPAASAIPDKDVMEFIDYLAADPTHPAAGGYKGVNFWRADLHGPVQWDYIRAGDQRQLQWRRQQHRHRRPERFVAGAGGREIFGAHVLQRLTITARPLPDTNSFGTNYLFKSQGTGSGLRPIHTQHRRPGRLR